MEVNFSESNFDKKKLAIVGVAGVIFSVMMGLVLRLAGVSPELNIAIVACVFIVLGFTLAYYSQESKEEQAEIAAEIDGAINDIMPSINRIVSLLDQVDNRLKQCSELIEASGKKLSDSANGQLNAVLQIRDKLGERASTVKSMLETRDDQKVYEARAMVNKPLRFPVDTVNSLVLTQQLPDLPSEQWEPTLDSILERLQKEALV